MLKSLANYAQCESGATAIEYGLIVSLISLVIIGSLRTVGNNLITVFSTISTALTHR